MSSEKEYLCTQCVCRPAVWANGLCDLCNTKRAQEEAEEVERTKRLLAYVDRVHADHAKRLKALSHIKAHIDIMQNNAMAPMSYTSKNQEIILEQAAQAIVLVNELLALENKIDQER